jgi:hypothetical protein
MADKRRGYVVGMAQRGELASLEEGAAIASTTKATVRRWLVGEGIDWLLTRRQWLARRHERCERWASDQPPPMRPTKAQMRRQIADAMRRTARAAELEKQRQADSGRQAPAE